VDSETMVIVVTSLALAEVSVPFTDDTVVKANVRVCNSAMLDISECDEEDVIKLSLTSLPAASSPLMLSSSSAPAVAM